MKATQFLPRSLIIPSSVPSSPPSSRLRLTAMGESVKSFARWARLRARLARPSAATYVTATSSHGIGTGVHETSNVAASADRLAVSPLLMNPLR